MSMTLPTGDYGEPLPLVWDEPTPAALPALPTPADTRPTLTARPVCGEADALTMGHIRDRQRAGFSADQSPIDDDRQRAWWAAHRNRVNAYLYYDHAGVLVGYGALLQRHDGTWVSSVAVLPGNEGHGYGGRITTHLVTSVPHEVYARALVSNEAACALHNARVWEVTGEDEQCRYFRTRPKVRTAYPVTLGGYE